MTEWMQFLLLGLGNGAVFAALAISVTLTYRSSGVMNFAAGAIAMYAGYSFATLQNDGALFNPVFGFPALIHVGRWPTVVNVALAVAEASLIGLVLFVVVFRPLRHALPLARVTASIGVMLLLQSLVAARLGTSPVSVQPFLTSATLSLGSVALPANRVVIAGILTGIIGALWVVYRFTKFGLRTRAVADSEKGALLSGIRSDTVVAANWVVAAGFAGLSGVLLAPITALTTDGYTLLIVPALAVALTGGLKSLGPPLVAGLALGMLEGEAALAATKVSWLPPSGVPESLPFVLILGYLVFRGQSVPTRGVIFARAFPRARAPRHLWLDTAFGVALGVAGILLLHGGYRYALVTTFLFAILGLSLVLLAGYVGQISFAQLTFAGLAGFLMDPLARHVGISFPFAPLVGAAAATALGLVIGIPALRVRGVNLAIITLACAVVVQNLYFENPSLTGGFFEPTIPAPTVFGHTLAGGTGGAVTVSYASVVLGVLVFAGLVVAGIRRSAFGAWALAVRANERAAAAAGINVALTKLLAFAIASFLAGLAGALWAYRDGTVNYQSFDVSGSLLLFMTVYISGLSTIGGGIAAGVFSAGGLLYTVMNRHFNNLGPYYALIGAVLLVAAAMHNPEGAFGRLYDVVERRQWRVSRLGKPPASEPAEPAPLLPTTEP